MQLCEQLYSAVLHAYFIDKCQGQGIITALVHRLNRGEGLETEVASRDILH